MIRPLPRRWRIPLLCLIAMTAMSAGCRQHPAEQAHASAAGAALSPAMRAAAYDPSPQAPPALKVNGKRAFRTLKQFVALGPRYLGSPGHAKAERFIVNRLEAAGADADQIVEDKFTAATTAGSFPMDNILAKFPGKKDGIIVIAGHYDTNYPLRHTSYIGANDGGSDVGLMLEIARQLHQHPPQGYSIWLLFTDGEEATVKWTASDSVYGSKQLARKWAKDGTAGRVKAFLLLDMIGDKDLDIDRDANSTPWLLDVVGRAADRLGYGSHFFARTMAVDDDHLPFAKAGIPVADLIDFSYGFDDLYHHTTEDTPDKCSAASLQITGDVVMETIRALNTH